MTRATTAIFRANGSAFINEMRKMSGSTDRLNNTVTRNFAQMSSRIRQFTRLTGSLFVGFSAVQFTQEIGRAVESSTRIGNTLRAAGINVDEFGDKLLSTAIEARAPIEGLANALLRLQKIRPQDGADLNLERVATLNRLAIAGGKTGAEASSVGLQTLQAIQSGFLQGDELRSLREAAPVELLQAIADQAGITIGELKEAGAQGRLTSDLVLAAIDSQSEFSQKAIADLAVTFSQATTNVGSAFTTLAGTVDQELGASSTAVNVLQGFAGLLQDGSENADVLAKSFVVLAQVAGVVAGVRGLQGVTNALNSSAAAARTNLAATSALVVTEQRAVVVAGQRRAAASLAVDRAILQGKSTAVLTRLTNAQTRANTTLAAAELRAAAATEAHNVAQQRSTFLARAGAVAWASFSRIIGVLGGPLGLISLGVLALSQLQSSAALAAEASERAADAVGKLGGSVEDFAANQTRLGQVTDQLLIAENDLQEAVAGRGALTITNARNARDALNDELEELQGLGEEYRLQAENRLALARIAEQEAQQTQANTGLFDENLLGAVTVDPSGDIARVFERNKLIREDAIAANALRVSELEGLAELLPAQRNELDNLYERRNALASIVEQERILNETRATVGFAGPDQVIAAQQLVGVNAELTAGEIVRAEIRANAAEKEAEILGLLEARTQLEAELAQLDPASDQYAVVAEDLATVNEMLVDAGYTSAEITAQLEAMLLQATATVAELDAIGVDKDNAARVAAGEMVDLLNDALNAANGVNDVSMAGIIGQIDAVNRAAFFAGAQLRSMQNISSTTSNLIRGDDLAFAQPLGRGEFEGENPDGTSTLNYTPPTPTRAPRSGGGGRGRVSEAQREARQERQADDRDALRFIQSMQTAEEKRIAQVKELTELRGRLVERLGEEHQTVTDLDEAMRRLEESSKRALFEGLRDDILSAIAAGDSLEDTLKRIGATLLELVLNNALAQINGTGSGQISGGGAFGSILNSLAGGIAGLFGGGASRAASAPPIRPFAKGGLVTSPTIGLIGEAGDEAVIPLQNGSVPVMLNLPDMARLQRATDAAPRNATNVINLSAPMVVHADGLTMEQVERRLAPRLQKHAQQVVQLVREVNEDDPRYLT